MSLKRIALSLLALFAGLMLVTAALNFSLAWGVAAVATAGVGLIIWLLGKPPPSEKSRQMISMVALFSELPFLDETVLERHAFRAWDVEFDPGPESETFVAGRPPLFLIRTDNRMYAVNYFDRPYFDEADAFLNDSFESRTRHIIQTHSSWISVDLMSGEAVPNVNEEYARVGKLLNQMINEDTLAILLPESMQFYPWDDSVEQMLTSDDPLSKLVSTIPPVFHISDDDPSLKAAVALARRRWPEFVDAFEKNQRDENANTKTSGFSVKAPVTVGVETEFIWILVTGIEHQWIYGTLGNQPVALTGLAEGDRVRVMLADLNDWVFMRGNTLQGGFTIKVLNARAQKRSG